MIAGIDPGLSGAVCFMDDAFIKLFDMPTFTLQRNQKNKRELDGHALKLELRNYNLSHVYLEQVGSMPGQGVSSVFAFGKVYGIIIGILIAEDVPFTLVHPSRWKKRLNVSADKDAARARASQLMPAASNQWPLKKHDGRAEAALLAYYGYHNFTDTKTTVVSVPRGRVILD